MNQSGSKKERAADYALTVVRVVLGVIFFMHGAQKVMGWFGGGGLVATVQKMGAMLPIPLVYLVAFGEFLGGIALIAGFLSRLAAAGILIIMAGAIIAVHGKNGFFLDNQGYEYNLALLAMSLAVALGGPGGLSVDSLRRRNNRRMA